MPTGKPKCPVCQGKGTLTEDTREYEFITRDPITSKCMICNGTGILNPSTKLPNGKRAFEVFRKGKGVSRDLRRLEADHAEIDKRLNVSKKAVINPEVVDTGVGYEPKAGGSRRSRRLEADSADKIEPYEPPLFLEMALNPRLNKVLASGKNFLIVTETEPYYILVYQMIREQETRQRTWTAEDEEVYVCALEDAYNAVSRRLRGLDADGAGVKELDSRLRRNDRVSVNDKKEAING